jgi:hypothetical protein
MLAGKPILGFILTKIIFVLKQRKRKKVSFTEPVTSDETIEYLLRLACLHGHLEVVRWFVKMLNVPINRDFLLGLACANGHQQVAEYLFEEQGTSQICKQVVAVC